MCQTFTFYFVCGHLHKHIQLSCLPTIENRLAHHAEGTQEQHQVCSDQVQETKIHSTRCETCSTIEDLSKWMKRSADQRLEMVRTFQRRPEAFLSGTERATTPGRMSNASQKTSDNSLSLPALTDGASTVSDLESIPTIVIGLHVETPHSPPMTKLTSSQLQDESAVRKDKPAA